MEPLPSASAALPKAIDWSRQAHAAKPTAVVWSPCANAPEPSATDPMPLLFGVLAQGDR